MKIISLRQLGSLGVLLLSTLLTTKTVGQGVVWFDNRPAYLPEPPPRRILFPDSTPVGGPAPGTNVSQYYAQLFYQDNTGAWVAHPSVARFFTSAGNAGYWNGGSRTLVNAGSPAPGQTRPVQMFVAAWDGGVGTAFQPVYSYDQARAQGRFWGVTQIFTYTEEWDTPRGTDDTYMKNFVGFVMIPEPSAIGLAIIGTGALLRWRRRR